MAAFAASIKRAPGTISGKFAARQRRTVKLKIINLGKIVSFPVLVTTCARLASAITIQVV
ncbi:MAG: hypothetical protein ACR2P3_06115 [Geminicoccaceae bacterium]